MASKISCAKVQQNPLSKILDPPLLILTKLIYTLTHSHPHRLPLLRPPYMCSLHNSPVKCVNVYSNVNRDIWQTISQVGRVQQDAIYQSHVRAWPINGGHLEPVSHDRRDLFVTG